MKHGWRNTCKAIITAFVTLFLVCLLPGIGFSSYTYDGEGSSSSVTAVESTEPTCYTKSGSSGSYTYTYYASIDGALTTLGSNSTADTLYVIQGISTTISSNCTIASGDTLVIPYGYEETTDDDGNTVDSDIELYTDGDEEGDNGTERDDWINRSSSTYNTFADSTGTKAVSNRVTLVTLAAGKTLTVNGNLYIGGQSGRQGSGRINQTNALYCEILMLDNSKIAVNGSLVNYGYIKKWTYLTYTSSSNYTYAGDYDNTCTIEVSSSGSVKAPCVIYDYKGGTNTMEYMSDSIFPFEMFDFPNLQVPVVYNAGAQLWGNVRIYAYKSVNIVVTTIELDIRYEKDICIIGASDDAPMIIVDSGSVTMDYQVNSNHKGLTTYTANTKGTNDTTMITVDGEVDLNYIAFNILDGTGYENYESALNGLGYQSEIDTRSLSLPISYKLNFDVLNGATLNVCYPVRFQPGSSAVIEEGATLNVKTANSSYPASLLLYPSDWTDNLSTTDYRYPSGLDTATITCNGTFNVEASFGGKILTTSSTGVFNASSGTLTASCTDGYAENAKTVANAANGYIGSADNLSCFTASSYSSAGTYWSGTAGNTYYDSTVTVSYTVPEYTGSIFSRKRYYLTITYTTKYSGSTTGSVTGSSSDQTGSYSVATGTTFTVSAYHADNSITLTATPASGTAQTSTVSSSSSSNQASLTLTADQAWTITMS